MKTVFLLRHAKSDWGSPSIEDHNRPLAPRGRDAAPLMGRWLDEHMKHPDPVLCSTAVRCQETLGLLGGAVGGVPAVIERGLYLASGPQLIARIQTIDDAIGSVLLIAHNPGMADAALMLSGDGDKKARKALGINFPTAALAAITFKTDHWREIGPSSGTLEHFVRPADLA